MALTRAKRYDTVSYSHHVMSRAFNIQFELNSYCNIFDISIGVL